MATAIRLDQQTGGQLERPGGGAQQDGAAKSASQPDTATSARAHELVSLLRKSAAGQKADSESAVQLAPASNGFSLATSATPMHEEDRPEVEEDGRCSASSAVDSSSLSESTDDDDEDSVCASVKSEPEGGPARGQPSALNGTANQSAAPNQTNQQQQQQGPPKKAQKPRRRVATLAQRRAANIRERRRMFNLNSAFDRLRKKVPSFAYEKRLSRIETLKLAIMYIHFMDELVKDDSYAEKYKLLTAQASGAPGPAGAPSYLSSAASYLSLYRGAGAACGQASSSSGAAGGALDVVGVLGTNTAATMNAKTGEVSPPSSPKLRRLPGGALVGARQQSAAPDKPMMESQARFLAATVTPMAAGSPSSAGFCPLADCRLAGARSGAMYRAHLSPQHAHNSKPHPHQAAASLGSPASSGGGCCGSASPTASGASSVASQSCQSSASSSTASNVGSPRPVSGGASAAAAAMAAAAAAAAVAASGSSSSGGGGGGGGQMPGASSNGYYTPYSATPAGAYCGGADTRTDYHQQHQHNPGSNHGANNAATNRADTQSYPYQHSHAAPASRTGAHLASTKEHYAACAAAAAAAAYLGQPHEARLLQSHQTAYVGGQHDLNHHHHHQPHQQHQHPHQTPYGAAAAANHHHASNQLVAPQLQQQQQAQASSYSLHSLEAR